MATYTAITSGEIDADSPITAGLVGKIVDNPVASHKYIRRSAQSAGNATSTLADDGTLEFAVDASTTYAFKFITYTTTSSLLGIQIAIDVPAAATLSVFHHAYSASDVATWSSVGTPQPVIVASYFTTTDDDPINVRDATDTEYGFHSEGIVTTSGAGTVKLRYANAGLGAQTSYIEAGSYLVYHRVDAV